MHPIAEPFPQSRRMPGTTAMAQGGMATTWAESLPPMSSTQYGAVCQQEGRTGVWLPSQTNTGREDLFDRASQRSAMGNARCHRPSFDRARKMSVPTPCEGYNLGGGFDFGDGVKASR